jgi:hypothetical protein
VCENIHSKAGMQVKCIPIRDPFPTNNRVETCIMFLGCCCLGRGSCNMHVDASCQSAMLELMSHLRQSPFRSIPRP